MVGAAAAVAPGTMAVVAVAATEGAGVDMEVAVGASVVAAGVMVQATLVSPSSPTVFTRLHVHCMLACMDCNGIWQDDTGWRGSHVAGNSGAHPPAPAFSSRSARTNSHCLLDAMTARCR